MSIDRLVYQQTIQSPPEAIHQLVLQNMEVTEEDLQEPELRADYEGMAASLREQLAGLEQDRDTYYCGDGIYRLDRSQYKASPDEWILIEELGGNMVHYYHSPDGEPRYHVMPLFASLAEKVFSWEIRSFPDQQRTLHGLPCFKMVARLVEQWENEAPRESHLELWVTEALRLPGHFTLRLRQPVLPYTVMLAYEQWANYPGLRFERKVVELERGLSMESLALPAAYEQARPVIYE
jgi:hypothetical protein